MPDNKSKFSRLGLPYTAAVDVDALSIRARYKTITVPVNISAAAGETPTAIFTINATNKHSLGPLGFVGTLKAAYVSVTTVPVGGTLTWKIVAYDASADGEVNLTDTSTNPETITAREAQAQVLATTNVELAADDTLEIHCISDNNTVTTDAKGLRVTLVFDPTESDPPTR
jgi:hypothetical protein